MKNWFIAREAGGLATLTFDYPPRAAYFRTELEQFLMMAHAGDVNPLTATGSYAGAMGAVDEDKLNVDGGAIAIGHPVGASGTRIVLHVLNVLRRTGGKRGLAAICIGGGLGGAMLIERV